MDINPKILFYVMYSALLLGYRVQYTSTVARSDFTLNKQIGSKYEPFSHVNVKFITSQEHMTLILILILSMSSLANSILILPEKFHNMDRLLIN